MCAIAGAPSGVSKMLRIQAHRGPDGWRVVDLGGFQIGSARLAITGSPSDPHPTEIDGRVLAFNGEIYNHRELRSELESLGDTFETDGDAEVLLRAYLRWGVRCLDRLNGMFAFAIADGEKIVLARDLAGEKPLYFSRKPLRFASEAKALCWRCEELPPASFAVLDRDGNGDVLTWWEPRIERSFPEGADAESAVDELEVLLADAIRIRTMEPSVLFLSDGVDSSLIRSFPRGDGQPWEALTYVDRGLSDTLKDGFLGSVRDIVWHLDYPIDSFSAFALWRLNAEAASKGHKVVLSGEGADELFGGYVRYVPRALNLEARDRFPSYRAMFPASDEDPGFADFSGKMRGLLRMGDRMAAAHGVENRCPFLDRRIVEFAMSLPDRDRAYGLGTKMVLRKILARRDPTYGEREKHGLFCSVNRWLGVSDPLEKGPYLALQEKLWRAFQ